MQEGENDSIGRDSITSYNFRRSLSNKSRTSIKPEGNYHKGNQIQQPQFDDQNVSSFKYRREYHHLSSSSKHQHSDLRKCSKKSVMCGTLELERDDTMEVPKVLLKGSPGHMHEENVFQDSEIVISDCWTTESGENLVKFVEVLKDGVEDEDDVPAKRRKLEIENEKSPPYTKEFHLLTEVQKARILTVVEDSLKKLANDGYFHSGCGEMERRDSDIRRQTSVERFFCKKFLLPWVIVKIVEMVLCHVIQFTFLSENPCFPKKRELLPVVVTYYITLFIILTSLVIHMSCFSYSRIQNPCYFMGVISSSILTLTTTLGLLILLTSMGYYITFGEILVLAFVVILLCSLFMELCLCYVELKGMWNRISACEQQHYIS